MHGAFEDFVRRTEMRAGKAPIEDYRRIDELFSISFGAAIENDISQPVTEDDIRYAAYTDDGEMTSAIYVPRYEMNYDGKDVKMAGIGGVATLPSHRMGGGIRAIFNAILPDILNEGFDFSYLYPFSTEYYMKFGYGVGFTMRYMVLYSKFIKKSDLFKNTYLLEEKTKDKGIKAIREIEKANKKKYNGYVISKKDTDEWVKKANPFTDKTYTFIYEENNTPDKGYVTFVLDSDDKGCFLKAPTLEFTSIRALNGLLSLMKTYESDYPRIFLRLTEDVRIERAIAERSFGSIEIKSLNYGMVRVVNAESVLKKSKVRGSGNLVIDIKDEILTANNQRFSVSFEDGVVTEVSKTKKSFDVQMSVNAFSTAIFGCVDTTELEFFPDVTINCPIEKLGQVFYKKPVKVNKDF